MAASGAVFALLVIVFVSQSSRTGRAYLTAPIVFMVAGFAVGEVLPSGSVSSPTVRSLVEVTLALMLFHDAAQLQPRELRADARLTSRLLLVGLPLTIGAGYLVARALLPGIDLWLALVVAAALAPTDAGLGAATVLNPVVPVRVRRVLNVESGLNDGLATPVVLFGIAGAASFAGGSPEHAGVRALVEVLVGALVGAAAGYLSGTLLDHAQSHGWAQGSLVPVAVLAVPLMAYYGAAELGGNGFIAAFVAGTAFATTQARGALPETELHLTDLMSAFLGYAVWMLFGLVVAGHLAPMVRWQNLAFAVLSLTVLRMVPVALCLLGSGMRPRSVAFIGWFGPRGLASVVFALISYESLDLTPGVTRVLAVIAVTVLLSVLAHGLSAAPWAARYGAWARRTRPGVESQDAVEPSVVRGAS